MPLSTLASVIRTPIQSEPEKAVPPLLFFLLIQFVIAQLCFQKAIKENITFLF